MAVFRMNLGEASLQKLVEKPNSFAFDFNHFRNLLCVSRPLRWFLGDVRVRGSDRLMSLMTARLLMIAIVWPGETMISEGSKCFRNGSASDSLEPFWRLCLVGLISKNILLLFGRSMMSFEKMKLSSSRFGFSVAGRSSAIRLNPVFSRFRIRYM